MFEIISQKKSRFSGASALRALVEKLPHFIAYLSLKN